MEIQIISGFLGAGKTTFLNQYLHGNAQKTVIIENEFGDIGIDSHLLEQNLPVREIYAGCICCSLAGDFLAGIMEIRQKYNPEKILIEPSGVGRLSDIVKACVSIRDKGKVDLSITKLIVIVDIECFDDYKEDFGDFYMDQIRHAGFICFSNIDLADGKRQKEIVQNIREQNGDALIFEGDWRQLSPEELRALVTESKDYADTVNVKGKLALPADKVFASINIPLNNHFSLPVIRENMEKFHSDAFGQILRAKAVFVNENGERTVLHYAGKNTSIEKQSGITDRESGQDFENILVIIGCGLKEDLIRKAFEGVEKNG